MVVMGNSYRECCTLLQCTELKGHKYRKNIMNYRLELAISEKKSFMLCIIAASALMVALLSISLCQQTYSQMMNPNMMSNGSWMMSPNRMGPMMNPGMMFNGSLLNPMMTGQNITGSIKLMPTMFNSIASQIKVSLSDAAASAQREVGNNSHAVVGHLDVVNGYLTYTICVIDPDMNLHRLVLDAGNGKVLSSSKISWQNMMMFNGMMGPMMMNPNMMGPMMMNPNMMGPMMMNPNMMGPMMMNPNMFGNMMGFR